jgi:hypothetical protein
MTNAATHPQHPNGKPDIGDDDIVSANQLGPHLGCSRQNIGRLVAEGILTARADGRFNQSACRLALLKHLRAGFRGGVGQSDANVEHTRAKTAMLQSKLAEREGQMITLEASNYAMEKMIGLFLTGLGGFPAKIGDRDMLLRRRVDAAIFDLRTALGKELARIADERDPKEPE